VVATTSGLAPGSWAVTEIVGKSIWGSGDTGSWKNATAPAAKTPKVSRIVATGRRMNGVDGFIPQDSPAEHSASGMASSILSAAIPHDLDPERKLHRTRRPVAKQGKLPERLDVMAGAGAMCPQAIVPPLMASIYGLSMFSTGPSIGNALSIRS
jgi:hypothetical protein